MRMLCTHHGFCSIHGRLVICTTAWHTWFGTAIAAGVPLGMLRCSHAIARGVLVCDTYPPLLASLRASDSCSQSAAPRAAGFEVEEEQGQSSSQQALLLQQQRVRERAFSNSRSSGLSRESRDHVVAGQPDLQAST
eukprot:scaffold7696_cov12-Tisochrysis_lutea.AAC.1